MGTFTKVVASGSLATSAAPIAWSLTSDGILTGQGNGQHYEATTAAGGDGSEQTRVAISRLGGDPYLIMRSTIRTAQRSVAFTLQAGPSALTVSVSNIDVAGRSGTATVTGSLAGAAVN